MRTTSRLVLITLLKPNYVFETLFKSVLVMKLLNWGKAD